MTKSIRAHHWKQERRESMTDYMEKLREFHLKYNHYIHPVIPEEIDEIPSHIRELRYKLIDEEVNAELLQQVDPSYIDDGDIALLADALADSLYVIFGTALSFGIPMDRVFEEVHRSNMTKSVKKNEYGKSIKGQDFEPPRIVDVLRGVI